MTEIAKASRESGIGEFGKVGMRFILCSRARERAINSVPILDRRFTEVVRHYPPSGGEMGA